MNKVTPNFGEDLVISNNPTILGIDATIQVLPGEIISEVKQLGYSKTFVQQTDPTLDPENEVNPGDYWVKRAEGAETWGSLRDDTWGSVDDVRWIDLYVGSGEIYCMDDNRTWVRVYDTEIMAEAFTRIQQTQYEIVLEAHRASAAEGQLDARIRITAEEIEQEVTRATAAEGELSGRITVTSEAITAEVTRATGAENSLSGRIDVTSEAITAEVTRATGAEGTLNANIASTTAKLALDAEGKITLSSTNFSSLGSSSSGIYITPTSINVNTSGSMSINTGGSLTISSGGTFSLTSSYFSVATDGEITCTKGTIGAWTIDDKQIKANSQGNHVALDGSTDKYPLSGLPTTTAEINKRMYAMWCGADNPQDAPFSVTKDGIVTIQSLRINKGTSTNPDYTTVDMRKWTSNNDEGSEDDPMTQAMGKLNFQTIKSITVNDSTLTMKITNGAAASTRTINFKKADPTHDPTATVPAAASSEPPSQQFDLLGSISVSEKSHNWFTQSALCEGNSHLYKFEVDATDVYNAGKDSVTHSPTIDNVWTSSSIPSGATQLNSLKTQYEAAKDDGDNFCIRVDCNGTKKTYYCTP